jgi:superfamily II DNA or RNA helicase
MALTPGPVDEIDVAERREAERPQPPMIRRKRERQKPKTPKEKWLAMVEGEEKRKEAESESQKQQDAWIEKEQQKRSMKERIGKKRRQGKGLEMAGVEGVLEGMPVGFYITPARPAVMKDSAW